MNTSTLCQTESTRQRFPPLHPRWRTLTTIHEQSPRKQQLLEDRDIWLLPEIEGPMLVVPITKTTVYLGIFWGPLCMETHV